MVERFITSPNYLAVTSGSLRSGGFAVIPTGTNPAHFDVQLVDGVADGQESPVAPDPELRERELRDLVSARHSRFSGSEQYVERCCPRESRCGVRFVT